ncbi:MAG: DEAD/DEAH box helicase family protein [Anaerolineae bacterium]|nr:DEAD/DEAH box helicase family protein [Anaerolineae bacterium]
MAEQFFEKPILNSPYKYPGRHWELDADGQPTNRIMEFRRSAQFITPVPKPKRRRNKRQAENEYEQKSLLFDADGLSTETQQYDTTSMVNAIRQRVDRWRMIPDPAKWGVTPETGRLLRHWRHHEFQGIRPFFCQIEAVETAIWLTEVAPQLGKQERAILDHLQSANAEANPELNRIALKLATGAGKTMVMAMIIAWQTINAVRHPTSRRFTRGFLIVTPGITIKDRLRVLFPNDSDSYYASRELVPIDLLPELGKAKIVITNYHAFKQREMLNLATGTRKLLQGRGPELNTIESEGQMIQRVMPELMSMKNILVLNDEAHHCYREKPESDEGKLTGDDRKEAQKNSEAARLWINGIEAVKRKLGARNVFDLSATPFFLRGSGYLEGTLFPWTVCDFSLMDAIECGIVKLPRVPVADNVPGGDMPKLRNLWAHIRTRMPKKGRGKSAILDPLALPAELQTALEALYGHYEKTYTLWQNADVHVPPVFIVVCNNTSTSKLVYDFIGGFEHTDGDQTMFTAGRLSLFRNYDEYGKRLARPRTLLIDSEQLESGDALDKNFREMASDEIDRFRRELRERGDLATAEKIADQDLLREVMNTVGKQGRLGESVRCVVSVSMLTEGWDCNTVTHILGIRAFGTQLLCEQVVGRALRRQSYDLNEDGLFNAEYADVLGIPFDFTAQPVVVKPTPPRETIHVHAVRPDRNDLEITFPRVTGYRVELPNERLQARFNEDSVLELTPNLVGPSVTHNQGIIGEGVELNVKHLKGMRQNTILYHLTSYLLYTKYRDPGAEPKLHLFGQLKRITRQWLDGYLRCTGGTFPAQLLYQEIADMACERIKVAITEGIEGDKPVRVILDPYNPTGSSVYVNFTTSKATRWQTDPRKCHVNWVICDSDWEAEFCRVVETHPRVRAYVKNQGLGLEVPYLFKATPRTYIPDFIVQIDDGQPDPLNLVVEIKGYRGEDVKDKSNTMRTSWVTGVNNLGSYGRWAFEEFRAVFEIEEAFDKLIVALAQSQS